MKTLIIALSLFVSSTCLANLYCENTQDPKKTGSFTLKGNWRINSATQHGHITWYRLEPFAYFSQLPGWYCTHAEN